MPCNRQVYDNTLNNNHFHGFRVTYTNQVGYWKLICGQFIISFIFFFVMTIFILTCWRINSNIPAEGPIVSFTHARNIFASSGYHQPHCLSIHAIQQSSIWRTRHLNTQKSHYTLTEYLIKVNLIIAYKFISKAASGWI